MKKVCLLVYPLLLLGACNAKDGEPKIELAGKGGSAVVKAMPKHHGTSIDSCMVYIKYNSQDVSSAYDDSVKCMQVDSVSTATFSGLKAGQYYLYAKGWDAGIGETVIGGLPYTITQENEQSVTVPVTEEH